MKQLRNQRGFTLVEIAIVLVIIGLLLGGVLKGQELIENGKVKRAAKDMDGVVSAFHSYTDRYRQLPGDDGPLATLTGRGGNWTALTGLTNSAGNVNGVIASTAAQTWTGGGESDNFWQHLKAAGFITGNPADVGAAAVLRNPFGGLMGFTNAAVMASGGAGTELSGNKVCLSQVPGKLARTLDSNLDDGLPNRGSLRATVGVVGVNTDPGAVAANYSEDTPYTVCRTL